MKLPLILLLFLIIPIVYAMNEGVPTTVGFGTTTLYSYWTYDYNSTADWGGYTAGTERIAFNSTGAKVGVGGAVFDPLYLSTSEAKYINYSGLNELPNKPMTIMFWAKRFNSDNTGYFYGDTKLDSTATVSFSRLSSATAWDGGYPRDVDNYNSWSQTSPQLTTNNNTVGVNFNSWVFYGFRINATGGMTTIIPGGTAFGGMYSSGTTINQTVYTGIINSFWIGNRPARDRNFNGTMDELMSFNAELSLINISQIYNDTLVQVRPYSNLSTITSLSVPSINNESIYLTWTNPIDTVFNHTSIYYNTSIDSTLIFVSNETGTNKNITGLNNNTQYNIYIYSVAHNMKNTMDGAYIINTTSSDSDPYLTYSNNTTDSTLAGTAISHNLYWNTTQILDKYIFQFCNGTWNGTGCNETIILTSNWANTSYDRCKTINITNVGVTTLTNYPVLINLTYDDDMLSDFSDVVFYSGACSVPGASPRSYEVDTYTISSSAMIWIKIPSLGTGTTQISAYYKNNTGVSNLSSGRDVFNDTYNAVYHLTDGPNGTESIGNTINITSTGSVVTNTSGAIGSALTYNLPAYTSGKTTLPLDNNIDLSNASTASVEVWVKAPNTANYMFWVQSQASCSYNFLLSTYNPIIANNNIKLCFRDQSGTTRYCVDSGVTLSGNWQYVVGTFSYNNSENQSKIYVDGEFKQNRTQAYFLRTGPASSTYLGNGCDYGAYIGSLDEVRVTKTTLTSDWINQTYQLNVNQSLYVIQETEINRTTIGGGWKNDTAVTFTTSWSNTTKIINSTIGLTYAWCYYANTTLGLTNNSCGVPFTYISTGGIDCSNKTTIICNRLGCYYNVELCIVNPVQNLVNYTNRTGIY